MRRTIILAAVVWCGGLCLASVNAYGYTMLNAWRGFGEQFQLGYVVGYLDAANLSSRHDPRAFVPTGGKLQYERWRDMVNAFYVDPANADRSIPDAMAVAGAKIQAERLEAYRQRRMRSVPGTTPTFSPAGVPTGAPPSP